MLSQRLEQKMLQKLSPQQIQLMKLLQVPTIAIEERIKEELENNPALEEENKEYEDSQNEEEDYSDAYDEISESEKEFDFSDYVDDDEGPYDRFASNYSQDQEERAIPITGGRSFHDLLYDQLRLRPISDEKKQIAQFLIGNIDDSGYLRRELRAMVDDLAFTQNIRTSEDELETLLEIIQDFDPPGVAARDLRECLVLQLQRKDKLDIGVNLALRILDTHFDEFSKKHYDKILKKFDINEDELKLAIDEILKLNPKPGNSMSESSAVLEHVVPDFSILNMDDELQISLNSRNAPELKVSRKYHEMLEEYSQTKTVKNAAQRDALTFVKQKLDSAKWFIDAIKQRQNTLMITMQAIVDYQREYFITGDETKLKPMILKDIADIINMDISTVSRVVNSKYVQTAFGTFLLKSFFSESLSTDSGEEVSTREVKKILDDEIGREDKRKPLTDEKLCEILRDKGYNIARRTVAKYREQLNIPVARLRKEL
jgi:RNA polymerase sigma-54 factor